MVTLRRYKHSCVSSFARFLYEVREILSIDDYSKIKLLYPRKPPQYEPQQKIIYADDIERILAKVSTLYGDNPKQRLLVQTLFILQSETALRIAELCSLTKDYLSFSAKDLRRAYIQVKGKGGKTRKVPFSIRAQDVVQAYMNSESYSGRKEACFWVYDDTHKRKTKLKATWLQHQIRDISQACRIPFTSHSFRHYRITEWANHPKIPITNTQLWAGHKSLTITQKYIHISDDQALLAAIG